MHGTPDVGEKRAVCPLVAAKLNGRSSVRAGKNGRFRPQYAVRRLRLERQHFLKADAQHLPDRSSRSAGERAVCRSAAFYCGRQKAGVWEVSQPLGFDPCTGITRRSLRLASP